MTIIKSFSVEKGDMFYIKHGSDNFTIIDCHLIEDRKKEIIKEIKEELKDKTITRFISTHPDDDHILNLHELDKEIDILNFYCVHNEATKDEETDSFKHYCKLKDDSKKVFHIKKNCSRKWMNKTCDERGSSGVNILWPDLSNEHFIKALENAKKGINANNISPIIKYSLEDGINCLWMGDLEYEFMESIKDEIKFPHVDVLFAPHHGRKSGRIPREWLQSINPKIIIVGEATSKDLEYYQGYNTITQNSAGDIIFESEDKKIHIFTTKEYNVDFLKNLNKTKPSLYYVGSLEL